MRHTNLGFWTSSGIYPWPFVQQADGLETPCLHFLFGSISTSVNVAELVTTGNVFTLGDGIS